LLGTDTKELLSQDRGGQEFVTESPRQLHECTVMEWATKGSTQISSSKISAELLEFYSKPWTKQENFAGDPKRRFILERKKTIKQLRLLRNDEIQYELAS
jgi:hypothetical protein